MNLLRCRPRPVHAGLVRGLLLALLASAPTVTRALAADPDAGLPLERPSDPPGLAASSLHLTSAAATVTFGRFTSVQVNVDPAGANIVGDAANEPSIAVDPNDPSRIAIGWRQFDTTLSNFRQAGFGHSADGGLTWITGTIDPGVFRSDPVLGFDSQGRFFYNSLTTSPNFNTKVYPSADGGATWGAGVPAFGGDKQWMTVDRTATIGHDHVYEAWSSASNPTPGNTFSRSNDDAQSFQSPTSIPHQPIWGTLDVARDGTLYMVGTSSNQNTVYVGKSTNAKDATQSPIFTTVTPSLGGTIVMGAMNPEGLLGQLWIAVDRTGGARDGWVYVLASVRTPTDPLDVMFIRSTDGGQTFSAPVRVNDDPAGNRAFQWFGTMSVAPNGRIDVVWNDTRGSADSTVSALYYSYSTDGGATWSPNEQASPTWNSTLGWPNQQKIGDYCHMISRNEGADLAWAATFNGEEDVYYLHIPFNGTTAVAGPPPVSLELASAPNPITASSTIRFGLPAEGRMKLEIFDAAGRRARTLLDGPMAAGPHGVRWDGTDEHGLRVKPGVYLCRLVTAGGGRSLKLMVMR